MHFVIYAKDATDPQAPERRLKNREEHLKIGKEQAEAGNRILGGPLLDENDQMCGSVIVVDFPSRSDVEAWLEKEPYVIDHVWDKIEVTKCQAKLAKDR